MGCLRADGRERLLSVEPDNSYVGQVVLAPPYAGLVATNAWAGETGLPGGSVSSFEVFDLRTGFLHTGLGGEGVGCSPLPIGPPACEHLDQIVLGSDGVSAASSSIVYPVGGLSTPLSGVSCAPGTTTCVAVDEFGEAFSSTDPAGGAGAWAESMVTQPPS
jgi:hypothetical protein